MRYMMMLLAVVMVAGCAEEEDPVLWEPDPSNQDFGVRCNDFDSIDSFDAIEGRTLRCAWNCTRYQGAADRSVELLFRDGALVEELVAEGACE